MTDHDNAHTLPARKVRPGRAALWMVAILAAAGTVGVMLLYQNITQRKIEARQTVFRVTNLSETTADPVEWGKNYPRQYDAYTRTVDIARTKYGGSEAFQKLDTDPRLRAIFDGYAFAIDYREERGHAYMLTDQRETERVTKKTQPGSCLQCHASNVVAYREAGIKAGAPGTLEEPLLSENGKAQLFKGFEDVCAMNYNDATQLVKHPVSCIDCHDPETMALRVTRPGFLRGIQALAASNDPVPHLPSIERWRAGDRRRDYDPNIDASRQEMRSMACGQCHVEYHFKGEKKLVTYPWINGLKVEQIERYYDQVEFKDWTHARTKAPVLKAQHPEFEMWSQGIHARSGVSCADCHMPYKREGAVKISDHQVRSPMLNIARACQTCHNYSETEILGRVEAIQNRTKQLQDRAEIAVVGLIDAIAQAMKDGATDEQLKLARDLHRKAQWRVDFVNAENSMGFHAPQEAARILGEAIDYARQGELEVATMKAKR
ncbi:MAG TPA: ammonia-forming cytochrome c nitrite reductase subunit c552 [Phycisphaerales bacterium]|nr:ammonia-forming cytochrome c nitrite reductase subunit c552 [Phycisphaerales bacterium]